MTTIEQTHHIEIDTIESPPRFVARCTDHQTQAMTAGFGHDDAARRFTCDPSGQRFIICSDDGADPVLTDLGGLRHSVRRWIENSHYSDVEALKYFRWSAAAPHLQALTIALTHPSEYDEHDYAHPRYAVLTDAGEHIAEVICRIDGRA
ncbi:hypothetical protein H7I77_10015 [Mycolicibacterium novocastrense]|uniref:Uncharacterized protein n=1 Tax=Mycolicibacterium novocastrense TaxID=59813 RepID=A0AAW5SI63_MYCNV|nr:MULTISPECIES: hypothetical protein [Mycolicibacterium]MCV7023681.1 hypothetical protein [Mycolicibacterium novocastrense]MDX1886918.1 hypothetical protein [Mycolicibacterium sp. 120270]GAT07673.1 uncharacterized protein RMCN_0806 [Mycolicibacterium novocastrense]